MIKKLLIANRGEIACRIIRTCRQMGIEAIALYSHADRFAKHVREADAAFCIGPAEAGRSYLNIAAILEAAQTSGAEAIHPGYGFLSENADFARHVQEAGLIWIGPNPQTIEDMGLKDRAKAIADKAGVPVLPGFYGDAKDVTAFGEAAERIGYPLLIKAIAGGGGRGIRIVRLSEDLPNALESASREAKAAFGDGRVMLEKLIERPRHIEVQVFGDRHGGSVHLFERDCSLQRRRQKVVEEAPAPGMPEAVRTAMTQASLKLCQSVGYVGAGTVEFIIDGARPLSLDNFWFLEMNTRLQVEHPVTEMITGIDLVAWQIKVATGAPIPLAQADIKMHGHAIEARICAEDPAQDFRPGAGLIEYFDMDLHFQSESLSLQNENLRWESGFETGDRVPAQYDSMIAKLIVQGDNREQARNRLAEALARTQLVGIPGNIGFLYRCLVSDAFKDAAHHVNWIADEGAAVTDPSPDIQKACLQAIVDRQLNMSKPDTVWTCQDGWRLNGPPRRSLSLASGEEVSHLIRDETRMSIEADTDRPLVYRLGDRRYAVTLKGESYTIHIPDYDAEAEALAGGDQITAPLPGKLISLNAAPGQSVRKGEVIAVIEAMKMEHSLSAPRDGVIETLCAEAGAQIGEAELIAQLVPE